MILNSVNYLVIIAIYGLIIVNCDLIRNEDICGQHNGRRLYLEFGDKGILYARNITFIKNIKDNGKKIYVSNSSHDKCSLEIVTCPSCAIVVTFKSLSLPHSCDDVGMMMDSPCRCDYVWISEPPYEDLSGAPYCGLYSPVIYKTSTRTVSITLLYSKSHSHAFTIEYTSERNRLHLNGTNNLITNSVNETSGGILNSPFFPSSYPRDLGMEYIITCPLLISPCKIRVLFSDFQLASVSIIEFYDWNGQRLDVSSGARFRPPIIVSSGPSLLIRFYANGGSGLGYKAFYSYVIGNFYDKTIQPITDCGGYVENLGGAITMMNMAVEDTKTFDCVWLIRPPKNFLHMKTHMYLKVVTFAEMAGNTELIVREGPTSVLLPLEIIRHPASQVQPPKMKEHIAPVANGFHVSLRGTFGATSRVAIAYTTFGYIDCFSGSDFLCQNHRCIPSQLNCDGFDHCGDNSDEPTTCFHWDVEPKNRWHMNKANYYFPKIDRYPDLQTATLVFVASSIGLIILISALIVLLYRMGARARQQRELQSRLQTISQLLDGARIDETPPTDDPPVYEAPPGYDEVVKTQHQHESFWKKIKINPRIETRCYQTQQRSRDSEVPGSLRIFNGESSSRNQESPAFSANIVTSVPESQSPPPPYATPPETIGSSNSFIKKAATYNNGSVPKNFQTNRVRKLWRRQYSYPGSNEITSIRPSTSIDPELIACEFEECWTKYESRIQRRLKRLRTKTSRKYH
ncbi:uncharacterized protein LOC122848162 isoform X2 [Aphidius gifuensis]|uniref:uncharacterized protein LOC122848162 isoform X2 n=1 Tax=Aphidius gifuensis TaxID=684658 RepID=UPI001CDC09C3|nr:uncharacterized protein LOC122848162 isoform X2 [Aphidius gifuensis]